MAHQRTGVCVTKADYQAVIFDLDGVITETARVHAAAWKQLFDAFLADYSDRKGKEFHPFDIETDYAKHVDGKPRYEGAQSFLQSREIDLPYGSPGDPPEKETVCGLGNRKNRYFQERLKEDGVKVYEDAVRLIGRLKEKGIKIAVISSSKNCVPVLETAGLIGLFDVKVDGVDSEELDIAGKPQPDIFLAATKQLGASPDRCMIIEDAIAGMQAGRKGNFRCVLGIDRKDRGEQLYENGADAVVHSMDEVQVQSDGNRQESKHPLPARECLRQVQDAGGEKKIAVFLDYDGTLTPIVERPEQAILSEKMRQTVSELAKACTVAVISGRGMDDVRQMVGLPDLFYAGSHGFEIAGPDNRMKELPQAQKLLPDIDAAEREIRKRLEGIEGVHLESKKFSLAVHYRQVAGEELEKVSKIIEEMVRQHPSLRVAGGKKVYELQPKLDWNKGKALLWILDALNLDLSDSMPLYIGDDETDEDAFRELKDRGIGILVHDAPKSTLAHFVLRDPREVQTFLEELTKWQQER